MEKRMYDLVPYNISPIQQGIQFGHAVVEYGLQHGRKVEYQSWAKQWKTFIILNGGTTNITHTIRKRGSLNMHLDLLVANEIPHSTFYEPDLGDQLTAVVFIVDERVFNKEKYPDPLSLQDRIPSWTAKLNNKDYNKIMFLREFLSQFKLA